MFVVRKTRCSVRPPCRMRKHSTVPNQMVMMWGFMIIWLGTVLRFLIRLGGRTGWSPGLYLLLQRPAPRTVSTGLSQNPFRGIGLLLILYCTDSVGLILSCNKLAGDRYEPLEVPAKRTIKKHSPQTQLL